MGRAATREEYVSVGWFLTVDIAEVHGSNASYTRVFNALDYVSCVFPVTKVDPAIDVKLPPHEFLSDQDESAYNLCKQHRPSIDDAPVSEQI